MGKWPNVRLPHDIYKGETKIFPLHFFVSYNFPNCLNDARYVYILNAYIKRISHLAGIKDMFCTS